MSGTYGYVIPTAKILYGLAVRGWEKQDLARAAGVSAGVVTKACAGIRVSPKSIERMAKAFASHPPKPALVELFREGVA